MFNTVTIITLITLAVRGEAPPLILAVGWLAAATALDAVIYVTFKDSIEEFLRTKLGINVKGK